MIPYPLNILGTKDEMHTEYRSRGIVDHVREQFAKEGGIQAVNMLVAGPNFDRFCYISAGKTIQYIPELVQRQDCHVSHSAHRLPRYVFSFDGADAFADIFCQIADAFKPVCNPQYPHELPQIA